MNVESKVTNKSKLALFAIAALQALLLILPVSAFAAIEDDQEIGVPQFKEPPRVKGCFGAVLSPVDDRLYVLQERRLIQYQIKPFRMVGSIPIDWEQFEETRRDSDCRVLITSDKSKLIIVYRYRMYLLDTNTGRVLSKFEKRDWERGMDGAVVNGNDLLMFEYESGNERQIGLSIWDANTLKLKRVVRDLGRRFGFVQDRQLLEAISRDTDRIYLATAERLVVLNGRTYDPELTFELKGFKRYPAISKDFQRLYVWNPSSVTDHISGKTTTFGDAQTDNALVFDYETREFSIAKTDSIVRDQLALVIVRPSIGQLSRNKNYSLLSLKSGRPIARLENLRTGERLNFQQYEPGEAILYDQDSYFGFTPGGRKYLEMKTATRLGVPINEATFNKFHRAAEANSTLSQTKAISMAEEAKEIGTPKFMESPAKGCFSAVLSPDSNRFYTVREGYLTQYRVHPFQRIDSIPIELDQLEQPCRIFLSQDKTNLIIVYKSIIFRLDARTGKILKRFQEERYRGWTLAAILNNDELFTFGSRAGYEFSLTIFDANTLDLKTQVLDFGRKFGFNPVHDFAPGVSKIRDRIYLSGQNGLVVLNSKTYEPELSVTFRPDSNVPSFGQPRLSKNFSKLYVAKVSAVTDHLTGKRTTFDEFNFSAALVFDQESRAFSIENVKSIERDKLDLLLTHSDQLSRNKGYVMVSGLDRTSLDSKNIRRYETFLTNLNTGKRFGFRQFDSGEAILFGQDNRFQLTPGARKYIKMENAAGKLVPINDATFAKYSSSQSLH